MSLDLPVPTVTLGSAWATLLNEAIELIDEHDHSSGKGTKVKPNGMNINADLDMQENSLLDTESVELTDLGAALTGLTNAFKIHATGGDLYYTNSNGTAVQITDGGDIVSTPTSAQLFAQQAVSGNLTILSTDDFVYLLVDTGIALEITLPSASALAAGRIYIIKDITGTADLQNITITPQGGETIDGEAELIIDEAYGCYTIVADGAASFYIS